MTEDGEIPFLDADPLSESIVQDEHELSEDQDERALRSIADKLRLRGGRSEDQIEELAVNLYNRFCEEIRSGRASSSQLRQAADLFGESPEELQARLQ